MSSRCSLPAQSSIDRLIFAIIVSPSLLLRKSQEYALQEPHVSRPLHSKQT